MVLLQEWLEREMEGGFPDYFTLNGNMPAPSARFDADTVNVGPGKRYDVVWTARVPGKWLLHCHIPHHTTNNVERDGAGGLMLVVDVSGCPRPTGETAGHAHLPGHRAWATRPRSRR